MINSNEIDNIWSLNAWHAWQLTTDCYIPTTSHSDSIGDQMTTIWSHNNWDKNDAIFHVIVSPYVFFKMESPQEIGCYVFF